MVILLAYFAVHAVGGMGPLAAHVRAFDATHAINGHARDTLAFIPSSASPFFLSFLVLLSLNWWASWYPGAEPGGGGYIAQRIFSAKNEKHSLGATLWFNIAHYALRPWPWILTALVALVLLPNPTAAQGGMEGAYVWVMVHYLPPSLRGLMLAGFAAAYMSTIGTHLNLGASYMINDIYKRFFVAGRSETALCSRVAHCDDSGGRTERGRDGIHADAWRVDRDGVEVPALAGRGRGAGLHPALVLVAHQRVERDCGDDRGGDHLADAGERLGMPAVRALHRIDPALALVPLNQDDPHAFAWLMLTTTVLTTAIWLTVTLATQPETEATLQAFYDRVRPAALGWRRFAQTREQVDSTLGYNFFHWALGFTLVYAMLFGVGDLLFGRVAPGCGLLTLSGSCLAVLFYSLNRRGWSVWR